MKAAYTPHYYTSYLSIFGNECLCNRYRDIIVLQYIPRWDLM